MSTRTMGSQGDAIQGPKSQSLARQSSLYSLTLDEVQNQLGDLGKPLGSMNLDELLIMVQTVESNSNRAVENGLNAKQQGVVSLQRKSSLAVCGNLSKKTVEEVWKDILEKKSDDQDKETQGRQPILGEMTLEDFLMKAGVIVENNVSSVFGGSEQNVPQWGQYQLPSVQEQHQHQCDMMPVFMPGHPVQQTISISANQIANVGYLDTQMAISNSGFSMQSDVQTPRRKRVASGVVVEKSVERRQKRMIKNRESAARSRARRQAYTHELENEVFQLEEENARLRKEMEMDKKLPLVPPPDPKHQLRRTSSSPL